MRSANGIGNMELGAGFPQGACRWVSRHIQLPANSNDVTLWTASGDVMIAHAVIYAWAAQSVNLLNVALYTDVAKVNVLVKPQGPLPTAGYNQEGIQHDSVNDYDGVKPPFRVRVMCPDTRTVVLTLTGIAADPVDLQVLVGYEPLTFGAYLHE